jgi:hypothetical protein
LPRDKPSVNRGDYVTARTGHYLQQFKWAEALTSQRRARKCMRAVPEVCRRVKHVLRLSGVH